MAEPPPPLPQRMPLLPPPLPQRMPLLPLPLPQDTSSLPKPLLMPKVPVADALMHRSKAASPTAPLPQPRPLPPPITALLPSILSSASSTALGKATSPCDHVTQNPRIGDSGDVESGSGVSTVDALQEIILYVGALTAAPLSQISKLHEEDGMVVECDSTSLSDICARMSQSCSYTVKVKVCGGGTEICGDSTFNWDIVEGSSSSLKDLLASIA